MSTVIVKCKCTHEYQDAVYGKGNRVANVAAKANGSRCTVCGAFHEPRYAPVDTKKKPKK